MYKLLVILIILLIKNSEENFLYSEPDLKIASIPEQWRDLCGFRYKPKIIRFSNKCFMHSFENKYIVRHQENPDKRVYGGRSVDYRESPWTVQFVKREKGYNKYWCTGVLLTMKHILTAAHCWKKGMSTIIFIGSDIAFDGNIWSTDKYSVYPHPDYKPEEVDIVKHIEYDIAIIILDTPIDWHNSGHDNDSDVLMINTVCLPKPEDESKFEPNDYKAATFFGFGRIYDYIYPLYLSRADIKVMYYTTVDIWDIVYRNWFISEASGFVARACKGDSGSGVIQYTEDHRAVLIGIVSRVNTKNDAAKNPPCRAEYIAETRIIRVVKHLNWINKYLVK